MLARSRGGGISAFPLRNLFPGPDDLTDIKRAPRADLVAGLTVAVVALPLALAFGVSSGLGAEAGLVTAIIGGAIAAVFGGSNLQVSGPTGAMTVVLIPVVHRYGVDGALMVGLMAGAILVGLALVRAGQLANLLPLPVIEGFTAGIAVVIALQQLPAALGVDPSHADRVSAVAVAAVRDAVADPQLAAPLLAVTVAAAILAGARWRPGLPVSLLALAAATLAVEATGSPLARIGALPGTIGTPSLAFFDPARIADLIAPAGAVAALAALESLLSATVADGMSVGERHHPDRELMGQGLANLAVPLFGGVPATAAIARTAVNVRAGASSRLAALAHAVILALIVVVAASLVGRIPLAALAGVLLATTARMVDLPAIRALLSSTRRDALVLTATFATTVLLDLVSAVLVGVGLAAVLALRSIARSATIASEPLDHGDRRAEEQALLADRIVAYRPAGPLFFGAADRFLGDLADVGDVDVVILRCGGLTAMDATGARMLGNVITHLEHRGIAVLLSRLTAEQAALIGRLVPEAGLGPGRVFASTPEAIAEARRRVLGRGAAPRIQAA